MCIMDEEVNELDSHVNTLIIGILKMCFSAKSSLMNQGF